MPTWSEYKETARMRGSLAFELYIIESTPAMAPPQMLEILPEHLAYQKQMESDGKLFLAGPLSDASGEEMSGGGMIIYRAASLEEATLLTENDPMHRKGGRTFTLRKWLVNEGSMSISVGFANQTASLS